MFRKNSAGEEAGREAGEPERSAAPAAPTERGADEARELPGEGPLASIVERLTARGADRAVLTLVQRGNTMTHQTEQSVGDVAPSVESGTVDQDSPLFDAVADLYSEAMTSPRGAWHRARIEVGPERDGVRPVVTTYGFADGAETVDTWHSGRPTPEAPASAVGTQDAAEDRHAPAGPAGQAAAQPGADEPGAEPPTAEPPADRDPVTAPAAVPAAEPAPVTSGVPVITEVEDSAGSTAAAATAPAAPAPDAGGERVPDHVDHEEWHEDVEPAAPTGPAAATAAAAAAGTAAAGEDHDTSAPETAVTTDVSPSYRAPAELLDRPSPEKLADGNLVLKEVEVLRRLADAQRRLFGEDGTAMDVSTVLVRVRALGTYYDALTHVRKNGFWDQRRTFDLVPEELLHVQELKDASYVEGAGAPVAMMFRFRPGIPPEVSFDYADEEAFVRYEERLPAQNYLEELRMYPRTGANIPQHMNEALQDWNY